MEELSGDDSDCAESARDIERNRLLSEKVIVRCCSAFQPQGGHASETLISG